MGRCRCRVGWVAALVAACTILPNAHASELIDRDVSGPRIVVSESNVALVTYRARGRRHRVAYWGAVDRSALRFRHRRTNLRGLRVPDGRVRNTCRRYRGPNISWRVAACTQPDGSHWALQAWRRNKPNYGGSSGPLELRISHFTGDLPILTGTTNWAREGRYVHLYGTLTFQGEAIGVMRYTSGGRVLDDYGRNVAIDSLNSDMGRGWRRINAILAHRPSGQFCYAFSPKSRSNPRTGASRKLRYRLSAPGPYVAPDVTRVVRGVRLRDYTEAADAPHNSAIRALTRGFAGRTSCDRVD